MAALVLEKEAGRKLQKYTLKKRRVGEELKKRSHIEKYIPHVAIGLKEILDLKKVETQKVEEQLRKMLEKHRGKLEELEFDPSKSVEFDEEFARIGREEKKEEEEEKVEEKEEVKKEVKKEKVKSKKKK